MFACHFFLLVCMQVFPFFSLFLNEYLLHSLISYSLFSYAKYFAIIYTDMQVRYCRTGYFKKSLGKEGML
jgi:hypothetical protein